MQIVTLLVEFFLFLIILLFADLHKPFSLDVFENDVYYGSEISSAVFRHDKFGRGVSVKVEGDMQPPYALKIVHPLKQPHNGTCSKIFFVVVCYTVT